MTPKVFVVRAIALSLLISGSVRVQAALAQDALSSSEVAPPAEHRTLVDQYCVTCHNERARTADLMFDTMDLADVGEDAEIWEEAVRKLRAGMMPPPGSRRPDPAAVDSFVSWLETTLDSAAARNPQLGHVALHRLNRTEYANAIRDILGIEINATDLLPVDDISDGFDNIANVLKVSPSFLDLYVRAARAVSTQAVGSPAPLEPVRMNLGSSGISLDRNAPGGLPLGTDAGTLVEHFFPADAEYEFSVNVGAGRTIMTIDGLTAFDSAPGGRTQVQTAPPQGGFGGRGGRGRSETVRLFVTAGVHKVGVAALTTSLTESDSMLQAFAPGGGGRRGGGGRGGGGGLAVTGPFNPTSDILEVPVRQRLFVCMPDPGSSDGEELECAGDILSRVARLAFRRDLTDRDLIAPLAFFRDGRSRGDFELGVQYGLMAILASPKFLYRAEASPSGLAPGTAYPIDDLALASRMSFFLWSQNPDDRLLSLASNGQLSNPDVLEQQVERMLLDPKSSSLVSNFAFQWLNIGGIVDIAPDPVRFPDFNGNLQTAFLTEMQMFIQSIIDEDRSVVDLLTADHTFVNESLAAHYDIPDVRGNQFRRVTLDDPNRWGLFGKGGVLMVTSYPNRTAPVIRGAWILERILGTPPATPPPDVEAFPETQEGEQALTVRERLVAHRANPTCNACHGVMDPLGFALENFDAIGGWQTMDRYARTPIDATGRLVDGTPVESAADLRDAITDDPEQFVQTFTEKLLMYALGRAVEYYDMPLIRQIVGETAADDYKMSAIATAIVKSAPFRMREVSEEVSENELAAVGR